MEGSGKKPTALSQGSPFGQPSLHDVGSAMKCPSPLRPMSSSPRGKRLLLRGDGDQMPSLAKELQLQIYE